jgi:hypothetical protein
MAALGLPVREPLGAAAATSLPTLARRSWIPTALLAAAALLLAVRRLDGALTIPLSFGGAVLCGIALVVVAAVCRFAAGRAAAEPGNRRDRVLRAVPTIATTAAAAALSLGGTSAAALVGLWLPIAVGESIRLWGRDVAGGAGNWRRIIARPASSRRICQQVTRFIDAAGRDVIEGTAVARFSAGQRTASVHLAFCPPFARSPEIACGAAADVAADVKLVQSLAYAARFDVKLSAVSAESLEVPVSFSARCTTT